MGVSSYKYPGWDPFTDPVPEEYREEYEEAKRNSEPRATGAASEESTPAASDSSGAAAAQPEPEGAAQPACEAEAGNVVQVATVPLAPLPVERAPAPCEDAPEPERPPFPKYEPEEELAMVHEKYPFLLDREIGMTADGRVVPWNGFDPDAPVMTPETMQKIANQFARFVEVRPEIAVMYYNRSRHSEMIRTVNECLEEHEEEVEANRDTRTTTYYIKGTVRRIATRCNVLIKSMERKFPEYESDEILKLQSLAATVRWLDDVNSGRRNRRRNAGPKTQNVKGGRAKSARSLKARKPEREEEK